MSGTLTLETDDGLYVVTDFIRQVDAEQIARHYLARAISLAGLETVTGLLVDLGAPPPAQPAIAQPWRLPISTPEEPPANWYISVWHDLTGARNGGYKHTGIDLNLRRWPRGDVDRGQPVFAIAPGRVHSVGFRGGKGWLGSIVIEHEHNGAPLYVRYAHLAPDFSLPPVGAAIQRGELLGALGDYLDGDGGDHLHHDMRDRPFVWDAWHTGDPGGWLDPLTVYADHIPAADLVAITRPL